MAAQGIIEEKGHMSLLSLLDNYVWGIQNRKNDLGSVQSACGDVLKMTGAMPGKRGITWPIYVPFMSLSSGPA